MKIGDLVLHRAGVLPARSRPDERARPARRPRGRRDRRPAQRRSTSSRPLPAGRPASALSLTPVPWAMIAPGTPDVRDGHLRRELRPGRQAADRPAQDRRREQVPPDLDRPPGGGGDPDEAPGRDDAAADDPRPRHGHARAARRAGRADHRHRAEGEHLLRDDHRRSRTAPRSRSTRGRPTRSPSPSAPRRRSSPPTR